jgi:hypothetical protein
MSRKKSRMVDIAIHHAKETPKKKRRDPMELISKLGKIFVMLFHVLLTLDILDVGLFYSPRRAIQEYFGEQQRKLSDSPNTIYIRYSEKPSISGENTTEETS